MKLVSTLTTAEANTAISQAATAIRTGTSYLLANVHGQVYAQIRQRDATDMELREDATERVTKAMSKTQRITKRVTRRDMLTCLIRPATITSLPATHTRHASSLCGRPLKRFKCKLLVMLIEHKRSGTVRTQAVMPDDISWKDLFGWVEFSLTDKTVRKHEYTLEYVTLAGDTVAINSPTDLAAWLDSAWVAHPPELHVYDTKVRSSRLRKRSAVGV